MKIIGLTGGIGTGKSTVSDYLKSKGYPVIDADRISHQLTEKGSSTLNEIADAFGSDILFDNGELNRKKLADIIFNDKKKKEQLEEITTKKVIEIIKINVNDLRNNNSYGIIFIDAPLLFETGADSMTDIVWLVNAETNVRISRVMERDGATYDQVMDRISNQMSFEEKKLKSDEIIDNSKGREDLYRKIEALLIKYD